MWASSRLVPNAGYAYANRNLPDRRHYTLDDQLEKGNVGLTTGNEISREFTRLNEHTGSAGMNYRKDFEMKYYTPQLLCRRLFRIPHTRLQHAQLHLRLGPSDNHLPAGFRYLDLPSALLQDGNYGDQGLYLLDDTRLTNDYSGNHLIASAYAAANLPSDASTFSPACALNIHA